MANESRTAPLPARRAAQPRVAAAFVLLSALAVIGLLAILIAVRNRAESTVADLATLIPLGWAFAAGMVASVNPCGFFMLPAYLSYQLGARGTLEESSRVRRVARALGLGVVAASCLERRWPPRGYSRLSVSSSASGWAWGRFSWRSPSARSSFRMR